MEIEGPAIRALGSLFKLNEVYIWEDGSTETREICLFPEPTSKSPWDNKDTSSNISALTSDLNEIPEDVELIEQMGALGLPLSFQSNKKTPNNKINKSKRKGARLKLSRYHEEAKDDALKFTQVSEVEIASPTALHDKSSNSLSCMSMLGQSESYYYDVAVEICDFQPADEESTSSTKIISNSVFAATSNNLSNSGQNCEFVILGDVSSNDENKKGINVSNSEAPLSLPCHLMDASVENVEKELSESLESGCLEDSSPAQHHVKVISFCSEESTELAGNSEIVVLPQASEVIECNKIKSHAYSENIGDWKVYWDAYYMRNYFYNVQTGTSTWDPPAGMEHLAHDDVTDGSSEIIAELSENNHGSYTSYDLLNYFELEEHPNDGRLVDQPSDEVSMEMRVTAHGTSSGVDVHETSFELQDDLQGINTSFDDEVTSNLPLDARENVGSMITKQVIEDDNMQTETGDPAADKLDILLDPGMTKRKKKARKKLAQRKSSNGSEDLQCQEILEDFSAIIGKYWHQRYLLFSRFDSGVRMDKEGWFSVTPEPIARHHALHCASDIIIDCFTGVGGNAIQFTQTCKHVIAIDVDPKKIDYARHNASIYGVENRIDFIMGDFFVLAPKLKADTVFLSPPWGGPDYAKVKSYNIMTMLRPQDGCSLFNTAKKIARRVVMFLPRNIDFNQLAELTLSTDHPWSLLIEKNYLNGKLKAITAYFSDATVEGTRWP